MWFSGFLPLVMMTATLFTPVTVAKEVVRYAHVLGLEFYPLNNGWKLAMGPGGFVAQVYVSGVDGYMEVSYLINHNGILDNNEAILSIWERQSGFKVGRLREIKYDLILIPDDIQVLDSSFRLFGIDPDLEGNENIPQLTIERGTKLYSSSWDSMRDSTSFGSDSINICTQFIETAGFYIEAFDFGREGVNNRWVKITFGVDEHQDGDSKEESED